MDTLVKIVVEYRFSCGIVPYKKGGNIYGKTLCSYSR